jgi:sphinganine-1-phosphate aldolase
MFNSMELRHYMYFISPDWTGGIYASPTMPGSRSGGLIAAAYATLVHMGIDGYMRCARDIMNTRDKILNELQHIDGIKVCGKPDMSVIAIMIDNESSLASQLNIYKIGESMSKKHWNLNTLQRPASIHLCVTYMHINVWQRFIDDMKLSIKDVMLHPDAYQSGTAAIYGMAASLPDNSLVKDIAKGFIDTLTKPVSNSR